MPATAVRFITKGIEKEYLNVSGHLGTIDIADFPKT